MTAHQVNVFAVDNDQAPDTWSWECWTCGDDDDGFELKADVEKSAENHRIEAATQEMIDTGELP